MKFAIHVGFSKTGTTTLQRHLFARHGQIEYLGKPYGDDAFKDQLLRFMMADATVYRPEELDLNERIRVRMEAVEARDSGKRVMVLSEEMLVSYTKVRDKGEVARRIHTYLRPQKIIITIRHQAELLKAAYLSRGRLLLNVPQRFAELAVGFDEWLDTAYKNFHRSYLEHADYSTTVDFYSRLFGKENVCVLVLEEMIHETRAYTDKLARFLDIDATEALSLIVDAHEHQPIRRTVLEMERLRTKLFPFHRTAVAAGIVKAAGFFKKRKYNGAVAEAALPDGWEKRLHDLYGKGNRRLIQEYGLPLEKYGYPVGQDEPVPVRGK